MVRFLIILGLVILLTGLLWPLLSRLRPGGLPGDNVERREHGTFYFPLATGLVISVVLSVLLSAAFWLFNR
jgi:hypothetical protein